MITLSDVVDLQELDSAIENGFVKVSYSPDGIDRIYNYTDLAQFSPTAFDIKAVRACRGLVVDDKDSVIARPWEKFFNYGQKPDDIDPSSIVEVTDKKDGCFSNKTRLNLWGGGTITIGEVVKNKLTPTLIGMNADGDLVPSRVTNWFDNGLKDNWLRVGLSTPASPKSGAAGFPNRMFVTPNHHVLHEEKYVPIGSLKVGDSLTSYIKSFSGLDLFLGGLLGDGSVCKNGKGFNYQEGHGESQRRYVEEQRSLFSDGLVRASDTRGGYADSPKVWLQVQNAQVFENLRNEWYPEGTKRVPHDLSFMNDAVVAKWFMDDGSRANSPLQQDRAVFSTNGFGEEDVRRLAAWLEAEYGVTAKVFNNKGWSIRLNYAKGTINKFWEAIAPYVFPSMEYKLPEEYRGKFTGYPAPVMILTPMKSFITSIEENAQWGENHYGRAQTRAFDIETETHNYMCQGVLVHNSLGIIHYDVSNKVRVATRGSFISEQALHATEWLKSTGWKPPSVYILHDYTILVEIIYPDNRIVCDYGDLDTLSLLGAVEVDTGRYLSIAETLELVGPDWPGMVTEVLPYKTLTEALSAPPRDGKEGMCVHFLGKNHIVKIKQEDYIALHKLVFNLSAKAIWERLVAGDSVDKIIDGLPDEFHTWVRDTADALISQANDTVYEATELYQRLASNTDSRKEFALEAMKTAYAPYLFALYDGKDIYQGALKSIKPSGRKLINSSEDVA